MRTIRLITSICSNESCDLRSASNPKLHKMKNVCPESEKKNLAVKSFKSCCSCTRAPLAEQPLQQISAPAMLKKWWVHLNQSQPCLRSACLKVSLKSLQQLPLSVRSKLLQALISRATSISRALSRPRTQHPCSYTASSQSSNSS